MLLSTEIRPTPEERPTLVFLHAFPFSSKMWEELVALLGDQDAGIITIDLPGFGRAPNRSWTMREAAHSLHEIFKQENIEKPVLCGLSMGGYVALAYCAAYPNSSWGLVLADTKSAADNAEVKQDRETFAVDALARGAIAGVERNLAKMTSQQTKQDHPEIVEQIKQWMMEANPQAIANALRAMAQREDTTQLLSTIKTPVLLIVGAEDPVTTLEVMQEMAASIPDAQMMRIAGASHMSASEKPQQFAAALRDYLQTIDR